MGTISTSGLYHPPAKRSVHTITASSVAQPSATGSAKVWITDYPGMFTYHADRFRSGVNLQEFALTKSTVKSSTFGKVFTRAVDGQIYAQPLYVANLTIAGAKHNVVFVATEHSSVYAFEADGRTTAPFWKRSFINPSAGITTIAKPANALIAPEISISSTPVIDTSTSTSICGCFHQRKRKHCSSAARAQPYQRSGKVRRPDKNSGLGSRHLSCACPSMAVCHFVPKQHLQRPALLLLNGNVYIAYGSNGERFLITDGFLPTALLEPECCIK